LKSAVPGRGKRCATATGGKLKNDRVHKDPVKGGDVLLVYEGAKGKRKNGKNHAQSNGRKKISAIKPKHPVARKG